MKGLLSSRIWLQPRLGVFIDLFCVGGSMSLATPRDQNCYPPDTEMLPPAPGGSTQDFKNGWLPPGVGGSHVEIFMIATPQATPRTGG